MKKLNQNANAVILSIIACNAKIYILKMTKSILLLFIATITFSSCSRSQASGFGCGSFPYRGTSMINNKDKSDFKKVAHIYKVQQNQKSY